MNNLDMVILFVVALLGAFGLTVVLIGEALDYVCRLMSRKRSSEQERAKNRDDELAAVPDRADAPSLRDADPGLFQGETMTTEEIYAIQPDAEGWRALPGGTRVRLGCGVRLAGNVRIGNDVRIGNGVSLGDDVRIGNDVRIGTYSWLGNDVSLGDYAILGANVRIGTGGRIARVARIGNDVSTGARVSLGNDVRIGNDVCIGNDASIGTCSWLGNYSRLGTHVRIGVNARLGDCVRIGNDSRIGYVGRVGNHASIGNNVRIGNDVRIGDGASLVDGVSLRDDVSLGAGVHLTTTPLQLAGPEHVVHPFAPGILGIGCMRLSGAEWRRDFQALAAADDMPPEHIASYIQYAETVLAWMKVHMPVPGAATGSPGEHVSR